MLSNGEGVPHGQLKHLNSQTFIAFITVAVNLSVRLPRRLECDTTGLAVSYDAKSRNYDYTVTETVLKSPFTNKTLFIITL